MKVLGGPEKLRRQVQEAMFIHGSSPAGWFQAISKGDGDHVWFSSDGDVSRYAGYARCQHDGDIFNCQRLLRERGLV